MRSELEQFVSTGSESVFEALVKTHADWVYSAARRIVGGDAHLAEDVTQTVFVDLARKAKTLPADVVLSAWLYRHTFFVASSTVRTEQRRRKREHEATAMDIKSDNQWEELEPHLDDVLNDLPETDREALILRFFEKLDFRTVGERFGIGEDAAQKRVSRAIERLRTGFANRGLTVTGVTLASSLLSHAVIVAPTALASSTVSTAFASAVGGTGFILGIKHFLSMNFIKPIVGAALLTGVSVPLFLQHQSLETLRGQNDSLSSEIEQMAMIRAENDRLAKLAVDYAELERLRGEHLELLELRGKSTLRQNQIAALTKELEGLRNRLAMRDAAEDEALTEEERQARRQVLVQSQFAKIPLKSAIWSEFGLVTPRSDKDDGGSTILTTEMAERLVQRLGETEGVDLVFSPRVTVKNGRQTQVKAVEIQTIITDVEGTEINTKPMTFGPVLDFVPTFLPDSEKLNMKITTTVSQFVGYDDPGPILVDGGVSRLPTPLPRYKLRQLTTDMNLLPGQTLVLTGGYGGRVPDPTSDAQPESESRDLTSEGLLVIIQPREVLPDADPTPLPTKVESATAAGSDFFDPGFNVQARQPPH